MLHPPSRLRLRPRTSVSQPRRCQIGKPCEHKLRYRSHVKARKAMALQFAAGYKLQFIYECPWCSGWHGTTGSPRYEPSFAPLAGVVPLATLPVHDMEIAA